MNKQHIIVFLFILIVVLAVGLLFINNNSKTTSLSNTNSQGDITNEQPADSVPIEQYAYFSGVKADAFTDDFVMHAVNVTTGDVQAVAPGTSLYDLEVVSGNDSYTIANGVFNENVPTVGNLATVDTDTFASNVQDTTNLIADVDASDEVIMTMNYTGVSYPDNPTDLLLLSEWSVVINDLTQGIVSERPFRFAPTIAPNNNLLFYLSVDGVYAYDLQTEAEFRVARVAAPMTTNASMSITEGGDLYLVNDQANTLTHYTTAEFTDDAQLVERGVIDTTGPNLLTVSDTNSGIVAVSAVNADGAVVLYTINNGSLTELTTLDDFLPQTVQLHTVAAQ